MKKLIPLCSTAACFPTTAYAQSTGSVEFEEQTIVVTGSRTQDVGGIIAPDSSKAKQVVTQELISRSAPGQTVLDVINVVPGVSFQNNDAYGLSGGTLTVRGFDSTRVSYTLDGVQLNDSGNYSIYSNFSIDPELIEQVNVNLGSTDVDSPTASAVGGTINQRTRLPGTEFGGRFVGTIGEYNYRRIFGLIDTGELTSFGTRAFVAGSVAKYDNPYNNYGKVSRKQLNARVYQPVGTNGDFVSLAGRYNRDRNNFFGSVALRNDLPTPGGFPKDSDDREYNILFPCNIDTPEANVRDEANPCGTEFDRRYNPSNSYNVRGNSRFTLAENLVLTVDPSYQYTKANGGGTVLGRESFRTLGGVNYTGFIGGQYYFGRDLNGDGDIADTCSTTGGSCSSSNLFGVRLLAPSQTRTHRYGVIAGLRYEIDEANAVRFTYTHDNANHRQTGEVTRLDEDGEPSNVFANDDPITDFYGNVVQKRDRQSYAILNQVSGEYRGEFGPLVVNAGVRLPFFKRDLENFCFTTSASGFIDCFGQDPDLDEAYAELNPTVQGPQRRVLKYRKLLPNIGAVYDLNRNFSVFGNYAKGLSVPSTDNLYDAFFFPEDEEGAKPKPETTDSFDLGVRYRSSKIQAQLAGWYTYFENRIARAYDAELDETIFRNLGAVEKYGLDGSIAWSPIRELTIYTFGSINRSKIKENLELDNGVFAPTKGKYEAGAPKWSFGTSVTGEIGPLQLGVTAKRTGPRYVYDTNEPVFTGDTTNPTAGNEVREIFDAKVPAYWLVNADARFDLGVLGQEKSYLQLNVYNLFDATYAGGFGGLLNQQISSSGSYTTSSSGIPFVQIGAPRTVSLSLSLGF